jgi:phosphoribosylamine--glycine ligase
MRILFITQDFSGASLCARLYHEGHEVRAHVGNPAFSQTLDGWIEKVPDLGTGLDWVGKAGLIVCDDNGFGPLQDRLRIAGYAVIGGSAGGDLLEDDREHAQRIFAAHGLRNIPTHAFDLAENAIRFLETEGGEWVLKFNGHADKTACYVAQLPDSADLLDVLGLNVGASLADAHTETGSASKTPAKPSIILQKRIRGVEIGVARYFNGTDWVGPIELNIEHKKLFPGDLGPKTAEMGTLLWYTADEQSRLFREVLAPLKPHLREIGFRGDFDINCIVNEDGAWPLEATTRFGYPAVQAQMALHETPWGEFLKTVADGKSCDLCWRPGYAVVVLLAVPPFPFCAKPCDCALNPRGLEIRFRQPPSAADWRHIHFEGVKIHRAANGSEHFYVADSTGYVLHVTGHGPSIEAARAAAYRRAENVVIPRMFYRTDIGERFLLTERTRLERLECL